MRQVLDKEMCLLLDVTDHHHGLAEVGLGVSGRMGQRHEHIPPPTLPLPDVVLHNRVAASEPIFVAKPLEHPLGRVPLLAQNATIPVEPTVDDPCESI